MNTKNVKTGNDRPRWRWLRWLAYFFALLLLATVLIAAYFAAGVVGGVELDVTTWKTRQFQFFVDPFTDYQLTYVYHDSTDEFVVDPAIAVHIVGGPGRPGSPRWDLVSIYRSIRLGTGEARILMDYLQIRNRENELTWVAWTNENPTAAPFLWSAVRDAVHLRRYDRLHDIFDAARIHRDPKLLKSDLDKIMLDLAIDEVGRRKKAGDAKAAVEAAKVGLAYGDSPDLHDLPSETSAGL